LQFVHCSSDTVYGTAQWLRLYKPELCQTEQLLQVVVGCAMMAQQHPTATFDGAAAACNVSGALLHALLLLLLAAVANVQAMCLRKNRWLLQQSLQ
jgi:hypothetical protein